MSFFAPILLLSLLLSPGWLSRKSDKEPKLSSGRVNDKELLLSLEREIHLEEIFHIFNVSSIHTKFTLIVLLRRILCKLHFACFKFQQLLFLLHKSYELNFLQNFYKKATLKNFIMLCTFTHFHKNIHIHTLMLQLTIGM